MKKIFLFISLIILSVLTINAQNIGIGTNLPSNSAMLDISSTSKGFLAPRMTTAQRTAIVSPANGLMVYDITTNSFWYYNNSAWTNLSVGGGGNTFTLPYDATVALTTTAFKIKNDEAWHAIEGESTLGTGVSGKSTDGPGVTGTTINHNGVYGYSINGYGMYAKSYAGSALYAFSTDGAGVNAFSTNGSGVTAFTNNAQPSILASNNNGPAIKGSATGATNPGVDGSATSGSGVYAHSVSGYGLTATSTGNSAVNAYSDNGYPTINAVNPNAAGIAINGTSNSYHAINGLSNGTAKAGIRGEATGNGGYGVFGTSNNNQGYGVYGLNQTGVAIYGSSNTGTGIKALSNSGLALEVSGKLKIAGGNTNPSAGAVLTSDATGNAVWKNNKIGFSVYGAIDAYSGLSNNVYNRVHFETEEYDYGNDYNLHVGTNPGPSSSIFTVPVSGLYHFEVRLGVVNENNDIDGGGFRIQIKRGGTIILLDNSYELFDNDGPGGAFSAFLSADSKLLAGDIVYVEVYQMNYSNTGGYVGGGSFQAHLVFAD